MGADTLKKILYLSLFLAINAYAEGPLYRQKDGKVQQEFENVYQDVQGKQDAFPKRTKAQLFAITPLATNLLFICTDCTVTGLVISTATTIGSFGSATAKTTAIN